MSAPDIYGLLRSKAAPAIFKHSESADLLRKSLLSHVRRVEGSKLIMQARTALDLLTLILSYYYRINKTAAQ